MIAVTLAVGRQQSSQEALPLSPEFSSAFEARLLLIFTGSSAKPGWLLESNIAIHALWRSATFGEALAAATRTGTPPSSMPQ